MTKIEKMKRHIERTHMKKADNAADIAAAEEVTT